MTPAAGAAGEKLPEKVTVPSTLAVLGEIVRLTDAARTVMDFVANPKAYGIKSPL